MGILSLPVTPDVAATRLCTSFSVPAQQFTSPRRQRGIPRFPTEQPASWFLDLAAKTFRQRQLVHWSRLSALAWAYLSIMRLLKAGVTARNQRSA